MANVLDVAAYILAKHGEMTAMKLQKLVYYSQAWHAVWTEDILFGEPIEAWADGPVCPDLFQQHRGAFRVSSIRNGNPNRLNADEKDSIDRVLNFYGDKDPQWLSDLTHQEPPWREARRGLSDRAPSTARIDPAEMLRYYSSL